MPIQVLPASLVNQIAAGEVIERPASVVKECLENAIDAGAHSITVMIEKGGLQLIKIVDDGHGIAAEQLSLAITNHATSKICCYDDLLSVSSLGFRGEALASIAAVSRFQLISRPADADTAYQLIHEQQTTLKPCAGDYGTTVKVQDLFYNVPARRKFMRSERTEALHIENVVKRIALANSHCAMQLIQEGKVTLQCDAAHDQASRARRLAKIFCKAFMDNALYIDANAHGMQLSGWIAQADFMRSQNDLQAFFVNQRCVKDRLINHALRQAYQDLLFPGRQAAFCLFLDIDPLQLDVNVHPTKQEVRFSQTRLVHDFIVSQIRHSLTEHATIKTPVNEQTPVTTWQVQESLQPYQDQSPYGQLLAVLQHRYAVTEKAEQTWLIDLLAAEKQCVYQRLNQSLINHEPVARRPLLVPLTLPLTDNLQAQFDDLAEQLAQFGVIMQRFTEDQCIIREQPVLLPQLNFATMLPALAEAGSSGDQQQRLRLLINHQQSVAYQHEQANKIIQSLVELNCPPVNFCQQTIIRVLTSETFHHLFNGTHRQRQNAASDAMCETVSITDC